MSTEHAEVKRLTDTLARLARQQTIVDREWAKKTGRVMPSPTATGGGAGRQWKSGVGVVHSDTTNHDSPTTAMVAALIPTPPNPSGSSGKSSSGVVNISNRDRPQWTEKMLRVMGNAAKPEKVGQALFGLQGLSSRHSSVKTLMELLVPFCQVLPTTAYISSKRLRNNHIT